jgi:uncharacterized protein YeaO (DUF488 family)
MEWIVNVMLKRAYESPAQNDGYRVLVDRLWPRGLAKVKAKIDLWLKAVAPSTELRQWFGHDPEKWREFEKRYRAELKNNPAWLELQSLARQKKDITLVYATKDQLHNEAVVLKKLLDHGT